MAKKDSTRAILRQFEREWMAGKEATAELKAFAKKQKVTIREALWIAVHYTTACVMPDDSGMDNYMSEWGKE